jgi:hypothetical protein
MASFLSTLFGGAAEKEAAEKNRQLYQQYRTDGTAALDTGMAGSKDALATAKAEYDPLNATFLKGSGLYADALGLNGADGTSRASQAFQAGPGYQFALDQGLQALQRQYAAAGMNASGNAGIDAMKFATGLANQEYNNWLGNVGGYDSKAMGTANARAGIDSTLANLYQSDASNRVNLFGNTTSGLASANNLQAQGEAAGAKNLLGGALSLTALATGGFGGGGALSSLFGTFGGNGSRLLGSDAAANKLLFPGYGTG